MGHACDVCLDTEPLGGVFLPDGLFSVSVCTDCFAFATAANIPLSQAADFLELCRMSDVPSVIVADAPEPIVDGLIDALNREFRDVDVIDPPELAAELVRPARPDGPPDPGANEIRVFQWPPHCGQWYALAGTPKHPRSIQYGGCRSSHEALIGLAKALESRRYQFDGGYELPTG
jgi:hypothetical protein